MAIVGVDIANCGVVDGTSTVLGSAGGGGASDGGRFVNIGDGDGSS